MALPGRHFDSRIKLAWLLGAVWLVSACSGGAGDSELEDPSPSPSATAISESPAETPADATGFTAMTYNTGLLGGPSNLDLREPAERIPDLVALITEVGADVVGLQEVSAQRRGDFESQLDHLYQFYDGDDPRNADVILLARDAFTVREQGVEALPSACRGPVRMTYLIAETSSGQVFGVANTHLCRQDPAGSVEQLVGLIAERLAGMPVILIGDLNATEGSEAIDYLLGLATLGDATNPAPFQDSWRLSGETESKQEAGAIPIDWILVADGGGLRFEVTAAAAVADPAQASDHIAIVADLQLR